MTNRKITFQWLFSSVGRKVFAKKKLIFKFEIKTEYKETCKRLEEMEKQIRPQNSDFANSPQCGEQVFLKSKLLLSNEK